MRRIALPACFLPALATVTLPALVMLLALSAPCAAAASDPGGAASGAPGRACGTPAPSAAQVDELRASVARLRAERPQEAAGGTIRVAFHVITSGGAGDVTDRQIQNQIRVLNQSYAGTGFRFTLASVDRTTNKNWFTMAPGTGSEKQAKQALAVDPAHTLNVYTCSPGKGLLGWAYFPFSAPEDSYWHGVVIHYGSLPGGYLTPYDLGGTLVHESGHYLGLFHTFQGGCVAPGDDVDDTPFEASPAFGCPVGRNTCPQPGDDPIHNYMDYTDDACYTEFSAGQIARMEAIVPVYRPSLLERSSEIAAAAERTPDAIPARANGVAFRSASPNPFSRSSDLRYSLAAAGRVTLGMFDVSGKRVRTLFEGTLPAGDHSARIDSEGLAPGVYFVQLVAGGSRITRTVVRVQ